MWVVKFFALRNFEGKIIRNASTERWHFLLIGKKWVYAFVQNFRIKGGKSFQFEQNSVEVMNDLVFDLVNLKNVHINGNNMGFSLKSPNALVFFSEDRSDCDEDEKGRGKYFQTPRDFLFADGYMIFIDLDYKSIIYRNIKTLISLDYRKKFCIVLYMTV